MEIRKILDILEAAPPQAGAVGAFGQNPNVPPAAATPAAAPTASASPSGGGAVAAFGKTAMANAPGGTTAPAAPAAAAPPPKQNTAAPASAGGYAQSAQPAAPAAPAAARPDVEAQKKGMFAPQAAQPVNNQSSGMTAQSQAQNTKAASAQATAPTSSGYTAQSQAQKSPPAAPTASPGAAAAMASKSAPAAAPAAALTSTGGGFQGGGYGSIGTGSQTATAAATPAAAAPAPAQTSDQIATAALNAPDQGTSGASLGIQGGFGKMAEEENLEEDLEEELAEAFNDMLRLSGLLLNEKAVSKQQQKFMGMVHAMQKGQKVKGASPELKKAAKTMSKKDAEDFARTKHKGLPKKVTEAVMLDEGGNALKHIANRFKYEVKNFMNTGDMADNLFDALYDYYLDTGEMPYGIAKAREGDPYAWVEERFYSDMGSEMSESVPVREVAAADPLQRLAELAGLDEDGPGYFGISNRIGRDALSPHLQSIGKQQSMQTFPKPDKSMEPLSQFADELGMASLPFFTKKEKSDYDVLKNRRAEREFQQSGSALTDKAGTIYDRAGNPKDMPGIRVDDLLDPKPNRDRDLYRMQQDQAVKNMQKEDIELNQMRRIAGLAEADSNPYKGVPSEKGIKTKPSQPDFKKSTPSAPSPSQPEFSKTTPSVSDRPRQQPDKTAPGGDTPSQQKEKSPFDRSTDELTECGDMEMDHDNSTDQESVFSVNTNMSSDGKKDITVTASGDRADELLQMLKMAGMRPHDDHDHMGMSKPEVIMVSNNSHHDMHDEMMHDEEMMEADRETEYANTPDEEYQTVASITRQGNDLNREKKQFANKPRLGDNPMAEDILNAELDAMLESILLRDDKDEPETKRDPKTGRVSATYPAPKKPDQSIPMEPESPESRVTGPRSMKVDGERTGTENYGNDDKEIHEEEKPTWLQRQPSKSQEEIAKDWEARGQASKDYVIPAERPYKDEKSGRTITPPRGATNPPQDPVYPSPKGRGSR